MMATLEDVQKLFPKAKYAPDPECSKCHGRGVYDLSPEKAKAIRYLRTSGLPCICIFIGDRELRKIASEGLAAVAREMRKELDDAKEGRG